MDDKDTIYREAAIDLVRDVCDAVMSGCESWYDPETEDEVYKDIREVDAILKCNKEVRIALRNMPSAQQDCTECEEYDHKTKSCPRYCDVIQKTLAEVCSVQLETQPEIDEILDYLDTELHPLVSPEHWDVYSTLHDMISLLHLKQPQQTGRCKDCLMRDVCRFEQFLGLNGFCSQWQKMEENDETD